jgi:hypothetical protein
MPENQRLHVAVQFLAISFVIFAIHREELRQPFLETLLATLLFAAEVSYPMKDRKPYSNDGERFVADLGELIRENRGE